MHFTIADMRSGAVYALMTQTIVPRPVAWVLTADVDGCTNLAPFSYFSPLSSSPPLLSISVGHRSDGRPKDTWANAVATGAFVVHIANRSLLDAVNESSAALPSGVSEADALGLVTVPLAGSPLPRLAAAPVALGCVLHRVVELGEGAPGLVIGRVTCAFVEDSLVSTDARGRVVVDPQRLDPVSRLGGDLYGTLGEVLSLRRPA